MGSTGNSDFPRDEAPHLPPLMGPVAKMGGQINDTGSKLNGDRRYKTTGPLSAREERF